MQNIFSFFGGGKKSGSGNVDESSSQKIINVQVDVVDSHHDNLLKSYTSFEVHVKVSVVKGILLSDGYYGTLMDAYGRFVTTFVSPAPTDTLEPGIYTLRISPQCERAILTEQAALAREQAALAREQAALATEQEQKGYFEAKRRMAELDLQKKMSKSAIISTANKALKEDRSAEDTDAEVGKMTVQFESFTSFLGRTERLMNDDYETRENIEPQPRESQIKVSTEEGSSEEEEEEVVKTLK